MTSKRNERGQFKAAPTVDRVIVFPRGQLSQDDKDRMLEHFGTLCIEADDPSAVVQLKVQTPVVWEQTLLSADAITASLLRALAAQPPSTGGGSINSAGLACHAFVKALADSLPKHPTQVAGEAA